MEAQVTIYFDYKAPIVFDYSIPTPEDYSGLVTWIGIMHRDNTGFSIENKEQERSR